MATGKNRGTAGFEGLFKGLSDLVGKLGELAEKGESLSRTGEFGGKDLKGIYGFSVKVGLGGKALQVEPFGNIRRDEKTGHSVVQEVREPMVDIIEEDKYTLVLAEIPGVAAEDVHLEVKDDLLTVSAQRGGKKYRKEILLPRACPRERMQVTCNNGILEIKCPH